MYSFSYMGGEPGNEATPMSLVIELPSQHKPHAHVVLQFDGFRDHGYELVSSTEHL